MAARENRTPLTIKANREPQQSGPATEGNTQSTLMTGPATEATPYKTSKDISPTWHNQVAMRIQRMFTKPTKQTGWEIDMHNGEEIETRS